MGRLSRMKVLLSAAGAQMRPLLALALPTFERFAADHGYRLEVADLDDGDGSREGRRQARWSKISLLRRAVAGGGPVLWVDADAMICRFDRDIAEDVGQGSFQGLVLERFPTRINPNTGVWFLRGDERSAAFLDAVSDVGLVDHAWTDQAAVCGALGWSLGDYHGHGARPARPSAFRDGTAWLHRSWNALSELPEEQDRIRHDAGLPLEVRRRRMEQRLRGLLVAGVV